MRHIVKGREPAELTAWKDECASEARPSTWKELDGSAQVVKAMRNALFAEQGHLCCYCGRRIVEGDSHIEHFVPRDARSGDPALTFEWTNLLASCLGNQVKGDPIHCGRKKENWYDPALTVSPLDAACEARFRYELDGHIRPAPGDEGAKETIGHLDLDGARLTGLRKGAIDGLFSDLADDLTEEDYERLAAVYRGRDADGKLERFCFVLLAVLDFFCPGVAQAAGGGAQAPTVDGSAVGVPSEVATKS